MKFDMSDFLEFADDCETAARMAPLAMRDAAMEIGFAVELRAKVNAQSRHKKGSGAMADTVETFPKAVSATSAKAEVIAPAVSGKGFPYPIVKDQGRAAIVMPKGRYMKFEGRNGPVFLKKLDADPGSRWFTDAANDTKSGADIDTAVNTATEELLSYLRGR